MTIVSGCIAESVLSVSTRDSPFERLEPSPEIEIVSAPRRLAANSKLARVRVEGSRNRLTIDLPRSVSSFLTGPSWFSLYCRPRSSNHWISSRPRPSIPSRPLFMTLAAADADAVAAPETTGRSFIEVLTPNSLSPPPALVPHRRSARP